MKGVISSVAVDKSDVGEMNKPHWLILAFLGLFAWAGLVAWQSYAAYLAIPRGFNIFSEVFSIKNYGTFQPALFTSHWLGTIKLYAWLFGYVVGAMGVGIYILNLVSRKTRPHLVTIIIGFSLGFAGLSLSTFLLGVVGGYQASIFTVLYSGYVLFGAVTLWKQREVLKSTPGWWLGSRPPLVDRLLGIVLIMIILFEYFSANAPELFFDALVYHLGVPAQWIQHHGIVPLPNNFFSNMPMNIEMLYTGALMLADERLCRFLHVTLSVLAGLTVFVLGRQWFGRRTGLWASGILMMIPLSLINTIVAGVDVGSSFFTAVAVMSLLDTFFSEEIQSREVWLSGILTGAALSCKYTTIVTLGPTILILLGARYFHYKDGLKKIWHMGLVVVLGMMICLMPWILKNIFITGNPFFPFFYKFIPTHYLNPEKIRWLMESGFRDGLGGQSWVQYLQTFLSRSFLVPVESSFVGAIFSFLIPGYILLYFQMKQASLNQKILMIIALFSLGLWMSQTQIPRFFLSGFPILAVLGALVLLQAEKWHRGFGQILRWFTLAFLVFWVSLGAIFGYAMWNPVGMTLGLQDRTTYFQKYLQTDYTPMARVINQIPGNVKVCIFGETRSYYFKKAIASSTGHDTNYLLDLINRESSAEAIWIHLRREGYTHIYIHAQEGVRTRVFEPYVWTPGAIARWQELFDRYTKRIVKLQQQSLYEILPESNAAHPIKPGRPLFTYDLKTVSLVNPRSDVALHLMQDGQWAQAEAAWQSISKLAPMWEVPYTMLAWMYQQQQKNKEALVMYEHAESLADLSPEMYHDLSVLYWTLGKRKEAIHSMKAAVVLAPGFTRAVKDLDSMEKTVQQTHMP